MIKEQSQRNINIRNWIHQTQLGKMLQVYKISISKELPNLHCSKLLVHSYLPSKLSISAFLFPIRQYYQPEDCASAAK